MEVCAGIDGPEYALKVMYNTIALDFSNEKLTVNLPAAGADLEEHNSLDSNDTTQMRISRDGEC